MKGVLKHIIITSLFCSPAWVFSQVNTTTLYFETDGMDAKVYNQATTTNYGTDPELKVYYDYGSPTKHHRTYNQIDLTSIPSNAIITSAYLHMYATAVDNASLFDLAIDRNTSSWTETGITWSAAPTATTTGRITVPGEELENTGWQEIEITSHVQYALENPSTNYGWRMALTTAGTVDYGITYASSENSNSNLRPYLEVNWILPVTDTIYFSSGMDALVNSGSASSNYGTDTTIIVDWDTTGTDLARRGFFYADLSSIPRGAYITDANIYLHALSVDNTADHPLYVTGTLASWTEGGITWDNQPAVTATNQASIPHASVSSTGWQVLPVDNLVQYAVQVPEKNFGWRIALQSESGTDPTGIVYASAEHSNTALRPYIVVEYEMPVVITGNVTHCTNGNDDGAIEVEVTGGCGSYVSYNWRKMVGIGYAGVEVGTMVKYADVSGLGDGLYCLQVVDYRGVSGYQYFFVGEEGVTTNVEFNLKGQSLGIFQEDACIFRYENTLDSTVIAPTTTNFGCHTNANYDSRSFVKWQVEWDPALEFTSARHALRNKGSCYQTATSDNDAWASRITGPWEERYVTWALRPTVSTQDRFYLPTTTTNGYEARNDTIDILDFIPYWQQYPGENYGYELSLNDYNQPSNAHRDYSSGEYIGHNLMVSFTVKPKQVNAVITVPDGTDDIEVTAQDGYPPYIYLWSNGSTAEDYPNAPDGVYWLKIWDSQNNMTRYQVSKENYMVWDSLDCADDSLSYIQFLSTCGSSETGIAYGGNPENVIDKTEDGWIEAQVMDRVGERAFGLAVLNSSVTRVGELSFGFYIDGEDNLYTVKNQQVQSTSIPFSRNDILKIEKKAKVVSFQVNGVEVDYFDYGKGAIQDLVPVVVLANATYLREIRYGTVEEELEDEPCSIQFDGFEMQFGAPVFYFCEGESNSYPLPSGYYYRWFPETGLSCYDCPNPVVEDAAISGMTYSLSVYHSYNDYLDGVMCMNTKALFLENENCNDECMPTVQLIPDLAAYCEGDVIQFMIDPDNTDYFNVTPSANFNCTGCVDPQYIVQASGETITFDFFAVPLGTENATACESIVVQVDVNGSCHDVIGASFNNYGANVWLEKTGTDNIFMNVHCNLLNEKVMMEISGEDQVVNGQVINEGTINVRNHWTNNAENKVFNEDPIDVGGHGTQYSTGIVKLFGGYQMVKGVSSTRYYNLTLTGSDKKELFVDTYAAKTLNLNHLELATRNNLMIVENPQVTAITYTDFGFVSSNLDGGFLQWEMLNGSAYFFPLGSSIGGFRYKPIEVTAIADINVKTRLVNNNPVYNGFIEKAVDVDAVSDQYFYYIEPESAAGIDKVAFHYHDVVDGEYQHIAHWDNVWAPTQPPLMAPWWEKTTEITLATPSSAYAINNKLISFENWSGFDGTAFVLAQAGFVINWESFGDSGDEEDDDGVIFEVVSPTASSEGGGLGTTFGAGGDDPGAGSNIFTPTPVGGIYQVNVSPIVCGVSGIIEFEADNSGNIIENSLYYVTPSGTKYPLADDLYALDITSGTGGLGMLSFFSIPEQNYACDNGVQINLTSGIILDTDGTISVSSPVGSGITVTAIVVKDNTGATVTPVSTTSTSWTAPSMNEGIYSIEVTLDDGGSAILLNGIFIHKNI